MKACQREEEKRKRKRPVIWKRVTRQPFRMVMRTRWRRTVLVDWTDFSEFELDFWNEQREA
jgi:hypothetical protein